MKKIGFTLAEVLITLGIIGVVAALTIPTLIQNHRNQVVETRLKKFYSNINQAILLAELDYGDRTYWHNTNDVAAHKDGSPVKGNDPREKWLNKYIVPYIKTIKSDAHTNYNNIPAITFADGSSIAMAHPTYMNDWTFYIGNISKCNKLADTGICKFSFSYAPEAATLNGWQNIGKNFEPYKWCYYGDLKELENACINKKSLGSGVLAANYCTALIQANGWKIPKNYPYKVRY